MMRRVSGRYKGAGAPVSRLGSRACARTRPTSWRSTARRRGAAWHIENRLHWVLDVVFHDDLARLRTGHGPENMAVVKHMAMNILRQAKPTTSLKNRRKLAGWNLDYLDDLIKGAA